MIVESLEKNTKI